MIYRLKRVGEDHCNSGYDIYKDEKGHYSVFVGRDGAINNRTWASLLPPYMERDMPIFTQEYCEYEGINRAEYDEVVIIS